MLSFKLASIFLVAGIQVFVAADDLPLFATPGAILASGDSDTALEPFVGGPVQSEDQLDDTKVIRGLLARAFKRQSCPGGWGLCTGGG
jgi:hypothetical protein